MPFDPTLLEWIQTGGVLLLLVIGILAVVRGDVVTRREFEDERADKLEWKQLYLEAVELLSTSVRVTERAVDK